MPLARIAKFGNKSTKKKSSEERAGEYCSNKCQVRIWKEGYDNIQCEHPIIEGCYCKRHANKVKEHGEWWLGLITDERPEEPTHYDGTKHTWKKDKNGNENQCKVCDDGEGKQIEDLLKSNNIELIKVISSTNRPSTQKLRIIADGHQVMRVDNEKTDDDRIIKREEISILIDDISWEYLVGSELHYTEELVGSFFTMRNPNAQSTCGCGVPFSVG